MPTSSQVTVIIDDEQDDIFNFFPDASNTTQNFVLDVYGGTIHTSLAQASQQDVKFVEILYTGGSISIFGNTSSPVTDPAQAFAVIIDGGDPTTVKYADPDPPSFRQWYQSPPLPEGAHNITLLNVFGEAGIDFATVIQSNFNASQTLMADNNSPIILDDTDPAITYFGAGWTTADTAFQLKNTSQSTNAQPYGNSTHLTSHVGDQFLITFETALNGTGFNTGISFYGVLDWTKAGGFNLSIDLDGIVQTTFFELDQDVVDLGNMMEPNTLIFESMPLALAVGQHTLVVTVTECTGDQTFILDYVTGSNVSFPIVHGTSASSSKSHAGAIAGGVVGGVILLLLVVFFDWMRRRRRYTGRIFSYPFQGQGSNTENNIALGTVPQAGAQSSGDHKYQNLD